MYFASLDILITEVYGLTECTGAQTTNLETAFRLDGVGRTIPGVKTKIHAPDEDKQGEVRSHFWNFRTLFMLVLLILDLLIRKKYFHGLS